MRLIAAWASNRHQSMLLCSRRWQHCRDHARDGCIGMASASPDARWKPAVLHDDFGGELGSSVRATAGEVASFAARRVEFTPTVQHCSMATLIGLCIRVKLLRALPSRFKVRATVPHALPDITASRMSPWTSPTGYSMLTTVQLKREC